MTWFLIVIFLSPTGDFMLSALQPTPQPNIQVCRELGAEVFDILTDLNSPEFEITCMTALDMNDLHDRLVKRYNFKGQPT